MFADTDDPCDFFAPFFCELPEEFEEPVEAPAAFSASAAAIAACSSSSVIAFPVSYEIVTYSSLTYLVCPSYMTAIHPSFVSASFLILSFSPDASAVITLASVLCSSLILSPSIETVAITSQFFFAYSRASLPTTQYSFFTYPVTLPDSIFVHVSPSSLTSARSPLYILPTIVASSLSSARTYKNSSTSAISLSDHSVCILSSSTVSSEFAFVLSSTSAASSFEASSSEAVTTSASTASTVTISSVANSSAICFWYSYNSAVTPAIPFSSKLVFAITVVSLLVTAVIVSAPAKANTIALSITFLFSLIYLTSIYCNSMPIVLHVCFNYKHFISNVTRLLRDAL